MAAPGHAAAGSADDLGQQQPGICEEEFCLDMEPLTARQSLLAFGCGGDGGAQVRRAGRAAYFVDVPRACASAAGRWQSLWQSPSLSF